MIILKCHCGFTVVLLFFIIHPQLVFTKLCFGYFDLIFFLLFKAINSDMKIAQKIVNNLIIEIIFPF